MVSKREKFSGIFEGVRCRICARKLTNPESVSRQIGPICFKKSGQAANWNQQLTKYQTRCNECGLPMQDVRHHVLWRERFAVECAKYCCGCCPRRNDFPCPGDVLREQHLEQQKQLGVFV